ncbi:MAG: RNA 3'-terminal phosphate cyclase [Mariniblastus sp.]
MIEIDGSKGEGGGQIVRSSLALSAITGKPFTIDNVRAGRKKPGLKRQHLTCVKAAREICDAGVEGDELGSNRLVFHPGKIKVGDYEFKVGTAGSAPLVAQTVLPALISVDGASTIAVEGGTHNPMAPCYEYLSEVYLPLVARMGPSFRCELISHGFYPAGGGRFEIAVEPNKKWKGIQLLDRDKKYKPTVTAIVSGLPVDIGERECDTIRRKMDWKAKDCSVREASNPRGPGNAVLIKIDTGDVCELFVGLGSPGVRAEQVARSVLKKAKAYIGFEGVPVGLHLADQIMLPMGLAAIDGQTSSFKTWPLTEHSLTHKKILELFLDVRIDIEEGNPATTVTIGPAG